MCVCVVAYLLLYEVGAGLFCCYVLLFRCFLFAFGVREQTQITNYKNTTQHKHIHKLTTYIKRKTKKTHIFGGVSCLFAIYEVGAGLVGGCGDHEELLLPAEVARPLPLPLTTSTVIIITVIIIIVIILTIVIIIIMIMIMIIVIVLSTTTTTATATAAAT